MIMKNSKADCSEGAVRKRIDSTRLAIDRNDEKLNRTDRDSVLSKGAWKQCFKLQSSDYNLKQNPKFLLVD
jgi:hypothetical protein